MTRCTRAVCFASNGWLVEDRDVCCGAGLRVEAVSSAQPVGGPTKIKIAMVRRNLIVSPSFAQAAPMVNPLSIVAQESSQLKSLPMEKFLLD